MLIELCQSTVLKLALSNDIKVAISLIGIIYIYCKANSTTIKIW